VSLEDRSPRRSDFYPKAQITQMAVQKMQVFSQKVEFGQTFVQKILVGSIAGGSEGTVG
jgi:hypothetical protein